MGGVDGEEWGQGSGGGWVGRGRATSRPAYRCVRVFCCPHQLTFSNLLHVCIVRVLHRDVYQLYNKHVAAASTTSTPPAERTANRASKGDDGVGLAVGVDTDADEAGAVAQFINIRDNDSRQS